jgi:hypothetical protein
MRMEFLRWIERLFRKSEQTTEKFTWGKVESLPPRLEERKLYLIGDDECEWEAAMRCPCGCGATIHLSLAQDSSPSWGVRRYRNGTVSLLPSVWRTVGCRSHFILYKGRILWCRDIPPFGDSK